jgi:hypothetical protein
MTMARRAGPSTRALPDTHVPPRRGSAVRESAGLITRATLSESSWAPERPVRSQANCGTLASRMFDDGPLLALQCAAEGAIGNTRPR